jgi:uncharacterized membrane protein
MSGTRLFGILLTILGLGITAIAGLWISSNLSSGTLEPGGALLTAFFVFVVVAILLIAGIYLFLRSGREAQRQSEMETQRRLIDIVKSRGEVDVHQLALELHTPMDMVKSLTHQLVGLGVFSGYVNWDAGTLYSADAKALREMERCKNCGGELKLVGKGVITCPYCGTEYFLS